MGRRKKAAAKGDPRRCGNLDCDVTGRDRADKNCARCWATSAYCSETECQRQYWRRSGGGDRAHCRPPSNPDGAAASGPASASPRRKPPASAAGGARDADDPEHPCPICAVNEDDYGKHGMCFACGQQYCGDCMATMRVAKCSTCHAPTAGVSDKATVGRLLRLVGGAPGRHTPVAMFNLARMYENGTGVPQDHAEAARLHRLATDQGNRLAADQGHAKAQCNLGVMCEHGTGVRGLRPHFWDYFSISRFHYFSRVSQPRTAPHAPCATLYLAILLMES